MKTVVLFFLALAFLVPARSHGQFAPVTSLPDTLACPGAVLTIPVKVKDFNNIGTLSLKILFNPLSLGFTGWNNVSGFPGLAVDGTTVAGTIVIGGFTVSPGGFSIPDNTEFFTLTFTYTGGNSDLTWFDNGPSCEYTGAAPGFPVLIDNPFSHFYINGSVQPAVVPAFNASTRMPGVNDTVVFSDVSTGSPTAWNWSFSPGSYSFVNGTTAMSQHPQVTFLANGPYDVSLEVTHGGCMVSITETNWIHAGVSGLWTGVVSSDWFTDGNWHNWVVPDGTTDVVIPDTAPNWPEYPGNFTVGIQCLHLTIHGISGQMTVTGDFIIP